MRYGPSLHTLKGSGEYGHNPWAREGIWAIQSDFRFSTIICFTNHRHHCLLYKLNCWLAPTQPCWPIRSEICFSTAVSVCMLRASQTKVTVQILQTLTSHESGHKTIYGHIPHTSLSTTPKITTSKRACNIENLRVACALIRLATVCTHINNYSFINLCTCGNVNPVIESNNKVIHVKIRQNVYVPCIESLRWTRYPISHLPRSSMLYQIIHVSCYNISPVLCVCKCRELQTYCLSRGQYVSGSLAFFSTAYPG